MMLSSTENFKLNYLFRKELEIIYNHYLFLHDKKLDSFWREEFNAIYNLREKLKSNKILDNTFDKDINKLYNLINN